jgi:hypothetical protein
LVAIAGAPVVARGSVILAGLGKIAGRSGKVLLEAVADIMLGSWTIAGEVGP